MTTISTGHAPTKHSDSESPYTFRELLRDVPFTVEDEAAAPYITCVDYWDSNLYIGASNGELLHFVSIPGEDGTEPPTFILASRLEPPFATPQTHGELPGVQQILLLPSVKKACVVCNGTYSFYTLPELSPAYGGKIKQGDCNWVGGLDENRTYEEDEDVIIIICLKQRIRVIRIGDQAKRIRDIELPGCVNVRRRGDLACVADEKSYSLIDVVNQRKIDLFPISSTPVPISRTPSPAPRPRRPGEESRARPVSMHFPSSETASPIRSDIRGHERISSLGAQPRNTDRLTPDSPSQWPSRNSSRQLSPGPDSPARSRSPLARLPREDGKPLPPQPPETTSEATQAKPPAAPLRPLILSPSPNEFLLTTGTSSMEPGVGMFVNENGDVSRGTIEFPSYPTTVMLEGHTTAPESLRSPSATGGDVQVVALVRRQEGGSLELETQGLDAESDTKSYLTLPYKLSEGENPGLSQTTSHNTVSTPSLVSKLGLRRLYLRDTDNVTRIADDKKAKQEENLIEHFATTVTRTVFYTKAEIFWLVRHPLLLKLDARLDATVKATSTNGLLLVQRSEAEFVFNSLRGRDPQDEIQFMTFNYIRQKAAILLLLDLMIKTAKGTVASQRELQYTQDALQSSDVEPRLVLTLVPALRHEVSESKDGIWVPGGLRDLLEQIMSNDQLSSLDYRSGASYNNLLPLLKAFLLSWRKKKGFGSIVDEAHVFQTVDASLLHVLLLLDAQSPSGPATAGSIRAELNDIVDRGVDCVDRAVELLESFHRLYVLSRLYQNQKKAPLVLATWRRILDGEKDDGGELVDGETDIRKYLTRIKDAALVRDYGAWLANRNPPLGVQIFADENSRVKFSPPEAVALLKEKAPNAVQHFLEHLVFTKKQPQYSADLISFYLTSLLDTLRTLPEARDSLSTTIDIYHSLPPPKPTFLHFTEDNAPPEEWHAHRLRLLQLLATTTPLSTSALIEQIQPFASLLVPESIILASRESDHQKAVHLLVHTLADFDTATRYCLRSGRDVFPSPQVRQSSASSQLAAPHPSNPSQRSLFALLLQAYLSLPSDARLDRTTELLARFGAWFDAPAVLALLPVDWPITSVEGFLGTAIRGLVRERRETGIVRALAAGENLRVSVEVVEERERGGGAAVVQDRGEVGNWKGEGARSWADSGYGSLGSEGREGVVGGEVDDEKDTEMQLLREEGGIIVWLLDLAYPLLWFVV
ncbi:Transforming growth factor-beta receptor-associated protein 1 [Sphaceloma murrayae]|uniref:Transforming growth factor-beta receptor-associated protein 1 n=1 Tax=Sphaceloma murrayae TaxID=2082308 RepID=A0A2K1QT68_9PEZI|nr:Transforming growth factor-beta receptor-associated protein 1 [Sphaceloma murrayae]